MSITRHNWTKEEIIAIYNKPMMDLLLKQLVSIENITIKRGSGFNIIVHKNRWLPGRLRLLPTSRSKIPHFSGQRFDVG
jgi:hypothetical protein